MSRALNAERVKTVRAARNAPWAGLDTAAATDAQHVSLCLLLLRTRGHCDAAAAAIYTKSSAAGRVRVIVSGWCSPAVMRLAAGDTSEDVRDVTFGMPGWSSRSLSRLEAPRCVLARAAFGPTPAIRALAAGRTQTPTAMMWRLARDDDHEVRAAVAANPNTSSDILTVLSQDDNWVVRSAMAANPNTHRGLLQKFVDGYQSMDDWGVVNPALSPAMLSTLIQQGSHDAYDRLADNPNTPPDVLGELASHYDHEVRAAVAANPNTDERFLRSFAADGDGEQRQAVAANPNTSSELLDMLAGDSHVWTRATVAANPNTSTALLKVLTVDGHPQVRQEAAHGLRCRLSSRRAAAATPGA